MLHRDFAHYEKGSAVTLRRHLYPLIVNLAKAVLQGTQLCTTYNKDENAWCLDVCIPLLDLAMVLYGRDTFRRESVQSQSIQPGYLPRAVDPSERTERLVFRKTDFCFSYSHSTSACKIPISVTRLTTSHKPRRCSQALRSSRPMVGLWMRRSRSVSGWRQVYARRRIWPGARCSQGATSPCLTKPSA
ncbi:hypothetical protein K458DRAFT_423780 [Lentithecium fluviatile CBS 122367]|uniref:PD-(D/E)XK nuclease-like domain-containing protein n=1 Tax=Lentithecium fluviatile CBS 122367 TaxID=1168545 RepID=A0A6G1IHK5_9PLEO|nr:hypothetical protein K458DRAFT_423780 [Lentithecium fluviatile CBS 122367]